MNASLHLPPAPRPGAAPLSAKCTASAPRSLPQVGSIASAVAVVDAGSHAGKSQQSPRGTPSHPWLFGEAAVLQSWVFVSQQFNALQVLRLHPLRSEALCALSRRCCKCLSSLESCTLEPAEKEKGVIDVTFDTVFVGAPHAICWRACSDECLLHLQAMQFCVMLPFLPP